MTTEQSRMPIWWDQLQEHLEPLRVLVGDGEEQLEADGVLQEDPVLIEKRYCNLPPECLPVLNLGVDGCHYAVWVDDLADLREPPMMVHASPMDSEAICPVARTPAEFVELVGRAGVWLLNEDAEVERAADLAKLQRAATTTWETFDDIGVVDPVQGWACSDWYRANPEGRPPVSQSEMVASFEAALAQGRHGDALVFARDLISSEGSGLSRALYNMIAETYLALGRPEYAEITRKYLRD